MSDKQYSMDDCCCGSSDRSCQICQLHGLPEHRKVTDAETGAIHAGLTMDELQTSAHLLLNAAQNEIASLTTQNDKLSKALAEIREYAVKSPYDNGLYEHVLAVTAKAGA